MKSSHYVKEFMLKIPTFKQENALISQGFRVIVGVDEVGCGALAGPICAGAVVLPVTSRLGDLKDSKLLSAKQRDALYEQLMERATSWAIGMADIDEIAGLNVRGATYLAMRRAVEQIADAQVLLVDAWQIPGISLPQINVIHGDRLIKSIAAASVVAKVTRDRLMMEYHKKYPQYGFDVHKGYGTQKHLLAIKENGPCEIHRMSYEMFRA